MTENIQKTDKTGQNRDQSLFEDLERRYGFAMAQEIIDQLKKAENLKKSVSSSVEYMAVKALSEAAEIYRQDAKVALKRLKTCRRNKTTPFKNIVEFDDAFLQREFDRSFAFYLRFHRGYTPGYTAKGKKQYRYYISQNLIQMRDHPDGLLGRLPAHEIETTVESVIRDQLSSQSRLVELMGLCLDHDAEIIQKIIIAQATISISHLTQGIIKRILVHADSLEIEINIENLCSSLVQVMGMKMTPTKETAVIIGAYNTRRVKRGALVIEPEYPDQDIFDLPPDQLKKLVQGFIWREEHFQGLTIRQIAEREGLSDSHVGKQIFATFELGQVAA